MRVRKVDRHHVARGTGCIDAGSKSVVCPLGSCVESRRSGSHDGAGWTVWKYPGC